MKDKLNQLYDMVVGEFGLIKKPAINWEQKRNSFTEIIRINQIERVKHLPKTLIHL